MIMNRTSGRCVIDHCDRLNRCISSPDLLERTDLQARFELLHAERHNLLAVGDAVVDQRAASSANDATVTGRSVSVRDVSTTYTEGPVPRLRIAESGSFATFASTAGVSVTVAVMP